MSAPGITPGPWEAADVGDYSDFDGNSRVVLGDDRRIAVVHHGGNEANRAECDANATAIAAVPAMIEALQLAVAHECGCGVGTKCQCFSEGSLRIWREEARDAAAEALKLAGVL